MAHPECTVFAAFDSDGVFIAEHETPKGLIEAVNTAAYDWEYGPGAPDIACVRHYMHPGDLLIGMLDRESISERLDYCEVMHDFDSLTIPDEFYAAIRKAAELPGVNIPYWQDEKSVMWHDFVEAHGGNDDGDIDWREGEKKIDPHEHDHYRIVPFSLMTTEEQLSKYFNKETDDADRD